MSAIVRPVASSSFYGTTVRQGAVGDAYLVEKRHRRRESLPWHGHRHAYVAFVLGGGYRERTATDTRSCEAGCAVVHPLLARTFQRELHAPDAMSATIVEGALLELAGHVLRHRSPGGERRPAWILAADDWLRRHLHLPIGLADLAAALDLSRATVARGFRAHLGTSVGERLRALRVEAAVRRLDGDQPLAELALDCGFTDQSHLTRCFRQRLGTTPGALRVAAAPSAEGSATERRRGHPAVQTSMPGPKP